MEIRMKHLTKVYGKKRAVDGLNLTLSQGVYGLLGKNGAGKSTFMRLLCALQKPDEGDIYLDGSSIWKLGERYSDILGYLPQDFPYYPEFTGEELLLYLAALKGLSGKKGRMQSWKLLEEVGLKEMGKKKIKTYSGGMKQRLGIAQAMLNEPKLLVLDEPTAGLDPRERVRFRNLIASYAKERIVLLSTHIVSDVECIADTIVMMKDGRILQQGKEESLIRPLEGLVWEASVSGREALRLREQYVVSNVRNQENQRTLVRFLGKCPPVPGIRLVEPNLEDLYLYYFGTEE